MSFFYNEPSGMAGFLDVVEERCAYFMRCGGGSLGQDGCVERMKPHALSPEKRARAIELGRTGDYNGTEIARMVGGTQSSVFKALRTAGIKVPDGRTMENKRRANA